MQVQTASHNNKEKELSEAVFSVNVINVITPPKDFHLGKWNSRELNDLEWKRLKEKMITQGLKPFSMEHMLPLVIDPRHVDPECTLPAPNAYHAKPFKLSPAGESQLTVLEFAGGRHRLQAVADIHGEKAAAVKALRTEVKDSQNKNTKSTDEAKEKQITMAELKSCLVKLEAELEEVQKWGVILYDYSK
jgi:hypothetical protein